MIDFSELKVYKRELLTDSPYTDCFMMLGQNEYKEKSDTMENKLHRMFLDSKREFRPSFTHLILALDKKIYGSNEKVTLLVGSAGYCLVPRNKLRLDSNEKINERLVDILRGHVIKFNQNEQKRTTTDYKKIYDVYSIKPRIFRNREGVLCVTWEELDNETNNNNS